ncbi:MAG: tetratricopeptide repeat protein [Armatimonadota bacterium]
MLAEAQGNDREIWERAEAASNRAAMLLSMERYDEAIAEYRDAVQISEGLSYFTSRYNYFLAKALTSAGRRQEALGAYRRAVRWDPAKEDLDITYPTVVTAMEYAILLAQAGREEDAKALYYYALRHFNIRGKGTAEPFPFLVVFAQEPGMVHWAYSADNLVAAATGFTSFGGPPHELWKTAQRMKPDWIIPSMYLVWQWDDQQLEQLAAAMQLARTREEREWAALYQPVFELTDRTEQYDKFFEIADRLAAIGAERRKNSVVLRRAKESLRNIHHRIAVTRDR